VIKPDNFIIAAIFPCAAKRPNLQTLKSFRKSFRQQNQLVFRVVLVQCRKIWKTKKKLFFVSAKFSFFLNYPLLSFTQVFSHPSKSFFQLFLPDINVSKCVFNQGTITEGEGLVLLASSVRSFF
jgi:hypothetical protein